LIGSAALQRRLENGELKDNDVPSALRDLHSGIVKRSPLVIRVDQQYDLAPLLAYYVDRFSST